MSQDSIEGIQKGDAVVGRDSKDIGLQELDHDDSHLLEASVGEASDQPEPVFINQFLLHHPLDHVQQLLGDEAFKGSEGLLLEHRTDGLGLAGLAFAENQLAYFFKQRRRWVRQFSLDGVHALNVRQRGQLPRRQSQERLHLVVNIRASRRRGGFLPGQQLGNVRLCDLSRGRKIPLFGSEFFEPMPDEEREIHLNQLIDNASFNGLSHVLLDIWRVNKPIMVN